VKWLAPHSGGESGPEVAGSDGDNQGAHHPADDKLREPVLDARWLLGRPGWGAVAEDGPGDDRRADG
jgi:hypothetical protein